VNGVNDIAQGLPRNNLAGVAADAPPLVAVVNDAEDAGVMADLNPADVPAFMLFGDSALDTELRGYKSAKDCVIAGAYITGDDADPTTENRNSAIILRAAKLSFARYNNQELSAGFRELNGVRAMEVKSVTEHKVPVAVGHRKIWGFLEIHLIMLDTLA
jgi:hypothetical protein